MTQTIASNAEESAAASKELNAQAESMKARVSELHLIIEGVSDPRRMAPTTQDKPYENSASVASNGLKRPKKSYSGNGFSNGHTTHNGRADLDMSGLANGDSNSITCIMLQARKVFRAFSVGWRECCFKHSRIRSKETRLLPGTALETPVKAEAESDLRKVQPVR